MNSKKKFVNAERSTGSDLRTLTEIMDFISPAITKPSHPRLSLAENIRILSRMTSRAVYYKVTTMKRNHLIILKMSCVARPVKNGAVTFTANYELGPPCKAKCKTVAMRYSWQLSDTMPRDTVQHLKDRYMNAKKNVASAKWITRQSANTGT